MEVKAHLRNLHMSPRKVRRLSKLVEGMPAVFAEAELSARKELAAQPLRKLLRSVIANARSLTGAGPERMTISVMRVNGGPSMKRYRPRSRGMAHPFARRTSHVSIVLEVRDAQKISRKEAFKSEAVKAPEPTEKDGKNQEAKPQRARAIKAPTKTSRLPNIGRRIFQRKSV